MNGRAIRLLDWLAVEFVRSGWDIKQMMRLLVTSATYQQDSAFREEFVLDDPENRLLARGPRFRMDAEMLRDQALAISGLLVRHNGGPAVFPYQPEGIWEAVSYDGERTYQQSVGASLYRRSLYTFWKRQSPPPSMLIFDAPTRETCSVSRSRTNTPLQSLALMNDPTFVEAARKLAERTMRHDGDQQSRMLWLFQSATSRIASDGEIAVLVETFSEQRRHFEQRPALAMQLLSVGDSGFDPSLNVIDLAAWTTIASLVMGLDETVTKP
ncbi:MAG: DUF1553 domain-containing protein [Pirellulaceae bacterium]